MKIPILLLISVIMGILFISLQQADAKILPNGVYLLQGNGFVVTEDSIEDSETDFDFLTGKLTNGRMKVTLQDGVTSISNDDYLASNGPTGTVLSDGRFIILSSNSENSNGDKITTNLFGRFIDDSKDGSVYSFTGKITKNNEIMKVVYIAKIVGTTITAEKPKPEEIPTQPKTIQINILTGSSNPGSIKYYSVSTVTVNPGTTIIWKNDDSVPHSIMSGIASFSHGKPFTTDGKIDSGEIAPGQTFQVTINDFGITRFFDSQYSWMDGVIVSQPTEKSKTLGKTTETAVDKKLKYLNVTGN